MKKQLLLYLLLLLPMVASADDSGMCGDNLTYTFVSETGTLTISGNGKMTDFPFFTDIPWYGFREQIQTVVIDSGVTRICNNAFYACSGLTSIDIPNTVTSIGSFAFVSCTSLASIDIPSSVISIGSFALHNTLWLDNQPDGLVYAGKVAYNFHGTMPSNTSIALQDGTLGIADNAFSGCPDLASITIPNSVTSIGSDAFTACSGLTSIDIPNSVTSIGDNAFSGCSGATSLTISNSLTNIPHEAFHGCSGLTSIDIPNSVTSIADFAFSGCSSATTITIGNSLTSIGYCAFSFCPGLKEVHISDIALWCSIPFPGFDSNPLHSGGRLYLGEEEIKDLAIPSSVTSIGSWAFYNCSSLTSITIPGSVKSIGDNAFSRCDQLLSVTSEITDPFDCNPFSEDTYQNGTLYIPAGTKNLYVRFNGWRDFLKIVEMDDSGEQLYLTLQDGAHGKMRLAVKRGENYTFKIEPDEGWKVNSVTFNDINMTGQLNGENQMTTPAITSDAVLSVVYEQTGSGVRQQELDALNVLSLSGGRVQIEGAPAGMQVLVYTLDGTLVSKCTTTTTSTTLQLPEENIYLIKVGTKTLKVSVR